MCVFCAKDSSGRFIISAQAARSVSQGNANSLALLAARNLLEVDRANRELTLHPTVADVACTKLDEDTVSRHREYDLSLAKENPRDWQHIAIIYGQIRFAWDQAPNDESLFPFLGILESFQVRRGHSNETLTWAERALQVAEKRNLQAAVGRLLEMHSKELRQRAIKPSLSRA